MMTNIIKANDQEWAQESVIRWDLYVTRRHNHNQLLHQVRQFLVKLSLITRPARSFD